MKIWVDDLREPPPDWWWCTNSHSAIELIAAARVKHIEVTDLSLDHDLGGDDTTRPVVMWMWENDCWPQRVVCHSSNPVGREWIEGMVKRYKQ